MASHELLQQLSESTLMSSAAILLVLVLRRPLRRLFGASVAYSVWLLVPATLLAMLLPAPTLVVERMPIAQVLVLPAVTGAMAVPTSGDVHWAGLLLGLWLFGALLYGLWLWHAQRAFQRGLGPLRPESDMLRAQAVSAGLPATLGLWNPQVVLPADFDTRFDLPQQALVLAHERCHIARRDPWVNAAAALLRCLFWFNPLFHLAAARLRHDQELACDADVLAAYPQQRRCYGDALLNTQLALQVVPLGCHFGFGHPLKERIMLLKQNNPSPYFRRVGMVVITAMTLAAGSLVWAAQPAPPAPPVLTNLQPGGVDAASRTLNPPVYPADAMREGKGGKVVLLVDVDAQGRVTGTSIERPSGDVRFDNAAQEAAAKWRYTPALEKGKPVASKVRVPIEFSMDSPSDSPQG